MNLDINGLTPFQIAEKILDAVIKLKRGRIYLWMRGEKLYVSIPLETDKDLEWEALQGLAGIGTERVPPGVLLVIGARDRVDLHRWGLRTPKTLELTSPAIQADFDSIEEAPIFGPLGKQFAGLFGRTSYKSWFLADSLKAARNADAHLVATMFSEPRDKPRVKTKNRRATKWNNTPWVR